MHPENIPNSNTESPNGELVSQFGVEEEQTNEITESPNEEIESNPSAENDFPRVDKNTGIYTDPSGEEWVTQTFFADEDGISGSVLDRILPNVMRKEGAARDGKRTKLYKRSEVREALKEWLDLPRVDKQSGIYTDEKEKQWAPLAYFIEEYTVNKNSAAKILKDVEKISGREKYGQPSTLYDLEAAVRTIQAYESLPKVDSETEVYTDADGGEWAVKRYFSKDGVISETVVSKYSDKVPSIKGKDSQGRITYLFKRNELEALLKPFKELPQLDATSNLYIDPEGKIWASKAYFVQKYGITYSTLALFLKDIEFTEGKDAQGKKVTLYLVSNLEQAIQKYLALPRVDPETKVYVDENGEEWVTVGHLAKEGISHAFFRDRIAVNASKMEGRDAKGTQCTLFKLSEIDHSFLEHYRKLPRVNIDTGIFTDNNGEEWATLNTIEEQLGFNDSFLQKRTDRLRFIEGREKIGREAKLYNIADVKKEFAERLELPEIGEDLQYTDKEGKKWGVRNYFIRKYQVAGNTVDHALRDLPIIKGLLSRGHIVKLFPLDEASATLDNFTTLPEIDPTTGIFEDKDGRKWITISYFTSREKISKKKTSDLLQGTESIKGRGLMGKVTNLYSLEKAQEKIGPFVSLPFVNRETGTWTDGRGQEWVIPVRLLGKNRAPDLLKQLDLDQIQKIQGRNSNGVEVTLLHKEELLAAVQRRELSLSVERKNLQTSLQEFLDTQKEFSHPSESEYLSLLSILGNSAIVDILYTLHPEYQRLPMKEVQGMLRSFLGEYTAQQADYRPTALDPSLLSHLEKYGDQEKIRSRLKEVMKNKCLADFSAERGAIEHDEEDILMEIIADSLRTQMSAVETPSPRLLELVEEVKEYFGSLVNYFDKKPGYIKDQLKEGRPFPDLFQRINIKELEEKRRVLIADEMGVGKSGSAILAKEILGLGSTLVLAPANVIDTWKTYLSAEEDGYFQGENLPKVLVVESPEDITRQDLSSFDYVLLSQERLNEEFGILLGGYTPDFLIVDEVHKLKNMEGVRSRELQTLATRVEQANGHLALLSGTPAPNKVRDVALLLKLLHTDDPKYRDKSPQEIEHEILNGDLLSIRADLTERMQRKKLRDIQSMPELHAGEDEVISVELDENERAAYEAILEDDEMTATEKMQALRTFLLNPKLEGAVGEGYIPSKVRLLNNRLNEVLQNKNKIVVFVNGYIEGVLRNGNAITAKLNLPEGVTTELIDGNTPKAKRRQIEQDLKGDNRTVVFVSGQTADVGVDFSAAEHGLIYNEPWTMGDRNQQISRIYRPPHEGDLTVDTLVTEKSIEEGIYAYIRLKEELIERLLDGGPLSHEERTFLARADQQPEKNLEENPELAKEYLKNSDELMRMFGSLRGQGEKKMKKFVEGYGFEYAHYYSQSSARSYEANANRVLGSLLEHVAQTAGEEFRVLDIGGGPEMLRQHSPEDLQDKVVTLDINPEQLANGNSNARIAGSMVRLPIASESVEAATFNFSLHYTHHKRGKGDFERYDALSEALRILKPGGRLFINHTHADTFQHPELLPELAEVMGAKVDEQLTGELAGDHYRSNLYVLQKVGTSTNAEFNPHALKIKHNKRSRLSDSRRMVDEVHLKTTGGEYRVPLVLNPDDEALKREETDILSAAEQLIAAHGGVEEIPVEVLRENGFCRYRANKKYSLFKKMEGGKGFVVYR